MNTHTRRRKSAIAAVSPLAITVLALLVVMVPTQRFPASIGMAFLGTTYFGLGPVADLAIPGWSKSAAAVVCLALWGSYLVTIAKSPIGLAPWWVHTIVSLGWLMTGLFTTMSAGLAVT